MESFSTDLDHPFELVKTSPSVGTLGSCPPEYRDRIVVDTVHDGFFIPKWLLTVPKVAQLMESGVLEEQLIHVRDWGANLVAQYLVEYLGLEGYHRVTVARAVLDFNRFPGSSPPDAKSLDTCALSDPLAVCLNHEEKRLLLEGYYDTISFGMEKAIYGKMIKLSIHTYDERNPSLTIRPEVSLLSRSMSYQRSSRLPYGLFDPLFPDVLVESSAKRILRDRIALTLEKGGMTVEHNYPYCLPDGSLEIRCQPWFFFHHVKQHFEAELPETKDDTTYLMVWELLFNTNQRSSASEALRGYLHHYRRAPIGLEADFIAARKAYEEISRFLKAHPELVVDYRRSPKRTSALSIEVRKDLVCAFDGDRPVEPLEDKAKRIAEKIAEAVSTYLREDLLEQAWFN